jgi:hypothetical protein
MGERIGEMRGEERGDTFHSAFVRACDRHMTTTRRTRKARGCIKKWGVVKHCMVAP